MEQPCPRCGYVSDRPARFCRQCGMPLFNESEASQAATRNYAPQPAPPGQQPAAPPSYTPYQHLQSDNEPTPETTRFYRPPVMTEPSALAPPQPAPRSHTGKILLIALLCLLVIGGGITLLIVSQLRGIVDDHRRPTVSIPAPPQPPPVDVPPPPSAPSLEQYQYPGAKITNSVDVIGNEVLTLTTPDSVEKVADYYRKQFGNPMVENRDRDRSSVVFHISGSPPAILTINPDEDEPGKTAISIVRSNFLPRKMTRE